MALFGERATAGQSSASGFGGPSPNVNDAPTYGGSLATETHAWGGQRVTKKPAAPKSSGGLPEAFRVAATGAPTQPWEGPVLLTPELELAAFTVRQFQIFKPPGLLPLAAGARANDSLPSSVCQLQRLRQEQRSRHQVLFQH